MGAEATTSVGANWARLEGQVVDGRFPLHRYLGSSDHSGVFITESAELASSEVAVKLLSMAPARAESQLARWHVAARFEHPHLVRFFDVGRCNVGGVGNLYAVMEYADQDLAQLLQRRALTEDEAREMLVPALSALAFLHERKLVLGRMKPSNVLVVGDQLKLASDAIRPVGELDDVKALSVYDPPEARDGTCSTACDVWALGVTLCEALTRRQPLGLLGGAASVVLPPDLPPAFREIVAWCLRRQPQDRPEVAEIDAWLSGQPGSAVVTTEGGDEGSEGESAEALDAGLQADDTELSAASGGRPGAELSAAAGRAHDAELSEAIGRAHGVEQNAAAGRAHDAELSAATDRAHGAQSNATTRPQGAELATAMPVAAVDSELAAGLESPASAKRMTAAAPSATASAPKSAASAVGAPEPAPAIAAATTREPKPAPAMLAATDSEPNSAPAIPVATVSEPKSASVRPQPTSSAPISAPASTAAGSSARPAAPSAHAAATAAMSAPATSAAPTASTPKPAPAMSANEPQSAPAPTTGAPKSSSAIPPPAASAPRPASAMPAATAGAMTGGAMTGGAMTGSAMTGSAPAIGAPAIGAVTASAAKASGATVSAPGPGAPTAAPASPRAAHTAFGTGSESGAASPMPTAAHAPRVAPPPPPAPASATTLPRSVTGGPSVASSLSQVVPKWKLPEKPSRAALRAQAEGGAPLAPRRPLMPLALGIIAVIVVVWGGIRAFRTAPDPVTAASTQAASDTSTESSVAEEATSPETAAAESDAPSSRAAASNDPRRSPASSSMKSAPATGATSAKARSPGTSDDSSAATINEVIPDVPERAQRTIRGHVRVSIRVIVENDGTVFAALTEQRGPSRYFERLAIEAAKQWTFEPTDSTAQRLMLVKFDFTRTGTTAQAVALK
jgi:TonB family protein